MNDKRSGWNLIRVRHLTMNENSLKQEKNRKIKPTGYHLDKTLISAPGPLKNNFSNFKVFGEEKSVGT